VRFEKGCTLTVGEGGVVAIGVERFNGNTGGASVQIQAVAGSALATSDYTFTNTQVNWSNGQSGLRTANLEIVADGLLEPTQFLTMQIVNPTGATIVAPSTKTVYIRNIPAAQLIFGDGMEGNCQN
jgi:hypothetical protein